GNLGALLADGQVGIVEPMILGMYAEVLAGDGVGTDGHVVPQVDVLAQVIESGFPPAEGAGAAAVTNDQLVLSEDAGDDEITDPQPLANLDPAHTVKAHAPFEEEEAE